MNDALPATSRLALAPERPATGLVHVIEAAERQRDRAVDDALITPTVRRV
jgi:hypothetical protein